MIASAHAFAGTPAAGHFSDAGGTAAGLAHYIGRAEGVVFALILLDASIIGASAVTLATSYAFGDMFGLRHSLHRGFKDAKFFYGSFSAMVGTAAAIVLVPHAPLGVMTTAVQALAGVLLPSATVFLLPLCNDREVLGPWVNKVWLNVVATVIVAVLIELSLVLVISTVFPSIDVATVFTILTIALVIGLVTGVAVLVAGRRRRIPDSLPRESVDKLNWRMPPLAFLARPAWPRGRLIGMYALRGYLVVAVALLAVKAGQIATGH